jgi:hypothetical protein
LKKLFPPSMIVSPASSSAASDWTVLSVGPPDGTITHTARGFWSFATSSSRLFAGGGALLREAGDDIGASVIDHARVAALHQTADHVPAHPAQADHPDLHRCRS